RSDLAGDQASCVEGAQSLAGHDRPRICRRMARADLTSTFPSRRSICASPSKDPLLSRALDGHPISGRLMTGVGRKRTGRFGAADQESGRRRYVARINARRNSPSRAFAAPAPVRTALTPRRRRRLRESSVELAARRARALQNVEITEDHARLTYPTR